VNVKISINYSIIFRVLLILVIGCTLITSDILLPLLPTIQTRFNVSAEQSQALISVFLLGFASMQLVYGSLSDRLGKRRLLLGGMMLLMIASLGIVWAQQFQSVLILRVFQAIGASAGITLGRAVVADVYDKQAVGNLFLAIFPVIGMSPAIAPIIGGSLYQGLGWRACFLLIAGFACTVWLLSYWLLPETRRARARTPLSWRQVGRHYWQLCGRLGFWHYALIPCFAYAAYFAYIAESPFLLTLQHFPQRAIGFSYIALSLTYVLGNIIGRIWMKKQDLDRTLSWGYWIFLLGGLAFYWVLKYSPHTYLLSITAMAILTLGNGILLPLGAAGAVTYHPEQSALASGLMGSLQMGAAAASAQWVGQLSQHQPDRLGAIVLGIVLSGWILYHLTQCTGK
jgi:MFS transporter, DHA1 family, multidrug resistance protein